MILTDGVTVFIDALSLVHLTGTTLTFVKSPDGSGFKFENPNDVKSCNCEDGCCE